MAIKTLEESIREWKTFKIKENLKNNLQKFTQEEILFLLDELENREEENPSRVVSLHQVIQRVPASLLNIIEADITKFNAKTIKYAVYEKIKKGLPLRTWYFGNSKKQFGPYNRAQIIDFAIQKKFGAEDFVWMEGMESWVKAKDVNGFFNRTERFISYNIQNPTNQEKAQQAYERSISKITHDSTGVQVKKSGLLIFAGVIQFTLIPFWIIVGVMQFFIGHYGSDLDWLFAFCSFFMTAFSIPIGIGLVSCKKWGFLFKVISSVLALTWFLSQYLEDTSENAWFVFSVVESISLVLVISACNQLDWREN